MNKEKLRKLSLEELHAYYGILSELCADYSRLTDGYSLATGDNKFQDMPKPMQEAIDERQEFFSYREYIKTLMKEKLRKELNE